MCGIHPEDPALANGRDSMAVMLGIALMRCRSLGMTLITAAMIAGMAGAVLLTVAVIRGSHG